MKKSQIASTDVVIAIIIFIVIVSFIFGYMLDKTTLSKFEEISLEGDLLVDGLSSSDVDYNKDISIISEGSLDQIKLQKFIEKMILGNKGSYYGHIKSILGITSDYCIYFEGDNGTVMYIHELIEDKNLKNQFYNESLDFPNSILSYGIGSKSIKINEVPCKGE